VRAVTLHQPWASLVAVGHKTVETRSWSTKYRGPLAIHAGKDRRPSRTFEAQILSVPALSGRAWNEMPFGAVVALCELVDVVPADEVRWISEDHGGWEEMRWCQVRVGLTHTMIREDQRPLGEFGPGRFAWLLKDIKRLRSPVPATGRQGLWRWEGKDSR
jgi:hypothetical protein